MFFPENIGKYLSLDEVCLSQGELYTVLTNKKAKGKKGALLAMVKGTVSDKVISILEQVPIRIRKKVKEVTLDLAPTMERIARRTFPYAKLVSDRFHVQQLAGDAVQQLRIEYRWEAIDQENKEILKSYTVFFAALSMKTPWIGFCVAFGAWFLFLWITTKTRRKY